MLNKKLSACIFFLLFIGLSDYGYGCHRNDENGPIPHGKNATCEDGGGGDGGGNVPQIIEVVRGDVGSSFAPLWAPTDNNSNCVLQKNSGKSLSGAFPRHDLCASLPDQYNPILRDDIIIGVNTSKRGVVLSVEVQGQDRIGTEGIVHVSDVIYPPTDGFFVSVEDGSTVIHVHADEVRLWKCDTHVLKKNSICDTDVGTFALADLVYLSDP